MLLTLLGRDNRGIVEGVTAEEEDDDDDNDDDEGG